MKFRYIKRIIQTLSFQIIAGFIIVCIFSTTMLAYILNNQMKKVLLENSINANLEQTKQLAYNLETAVNSCAQTAMVLTMDKDVQQAFHLNPDISLEKVEVLRAAFYSMASHLVISPIIDSIFLYDEFSHIIGVESNRNIFIENELSQDQYMEKITYNASALTNARELQQSFQYIGSFSTQEFRYTRSTHYNISQYMSFTWFFPMTQTLSQNIATVININERRMRSIYNSQGDNVSVLYIADKNGIIISHSDENLLKHQSLAFTGIRREDRSGWFDYKGEDETIQITYSSIGNYGLYLVKETPISIILHDVTLVQNFTAILLFIELFLLSALSTTMVLKLTSPLKHLTRYMKQVGQGYFGQTVTAGAPKNEIGALITQFNEMSLSIRRLTDQNRETDKQKRISELQSLQSYINPHFLYNTFYAFRFMATLYNADKLAEGIGSFMNLLGPLYKNTDTAWTLREELAFIRQYAHVMNFRYGGAVCVDFYFPEKIMEKRVLKFLLQPLIENAFQYGISPDSGTGDIIVRLEENNGIFVFTIRDNGQGISPEKLKSLKMEMETQSMDLSEKGLGISNIHKRIRLYYGKAYGITLASASDGTEVTLRIPADAVDN